MALAMACRLPQPSFTNLTLYSQPDRFGPGSCGSHSSSDRSSEKGVPLFAKWRWILTSNRKPSATRVVGGLIGGLIFGVCYSIIALALHFGSGGTALSAVGVAPLMLVMLYLVGCTAGGGLVGWMWPLTETRPGAVAVGIVGLLPVCNSILIGRFTFANRAAKLVVADSFRITTRAGTFEASNP
jgi:hypothetical protein